LTLEQAEGIRKEYAQGQRPAHLGRQYGVTRKAIYNNVQGRTYLTGAQAPAMAETRSSESPAPGPAAA
jgi:hypothetical protein